MRLRQLELVRYGHFTGTALTFDPAPGVLNVLEAPNGAGKSVVRQAILELLFGFHPRTPMNFLHDYPRLELRAEATLPSGEASAFMRRKREVNGLSDLSGKPAIAALLGALPRENERARLERLFVLNSAQLREGGRALLDTDGDLADALLSSAGDIGSSRTLARKFADQRDAAAPARKGSAPFYSAMEAWVAANTAVGQSLVKPAQVEAKQGQRDQAVRDQAAAKQQAAAAARSLRQLNRVQRCRTHLDVLDRAQAWLRDNPAPRATPAEAAERFRTAKPAAEAAAQKLATAAEAHAAAVEKAATATVDQAALAQAPAIDHLVARIVQSEASARDLPGQEQAQAGAEADISRLLRDLGSPRPPADAEHELRPTADIAAARALIADLPAVERAEMEASVERKSRRSAVDQAEDELQLPAPAASELLRAAVDEAGVDGDPAKRLRESVQAVADATAAATLALAQVPGWNGSLAALEALAVPSPPTLQRLGQALTAATSTAEQAAARSMTEAQLAGQALDELSRVLTTGPLPDRAAVAEARAHRNRGWALVAARLAGTPDPAEPDYAPLPLPLAFQAAMTAADDVADQRADEMERVGKVETLQDAASRATLAAAEAARAAASAAEAMQLAAAEWAATLRPLGLPGTAGLQEVQELVVGRKAALEAAADHRSKQAAADALASRQAELAATLAAALDLPPESLPGPLPRLLAIARKRVSDADSALGRRRDLARHLLETRRKLQEAGPAMAAAQAARARWDGRWAAVLQRLGRPADEPPRVTATVLDRLVGLGGAVEQARTARTRVTDMTRQLQTFAADAAQLATALDDPAAGPPLAVAQRLGERLKLARSAAERRDTLADQVSQAARLLEAARREDAGQTGALVAAALALGAATIEEAQHQLDLATARAEQEAIAAAAAARLAEDGDSLPLAELRAELAAHPAASVQEAKCQAEAAVADAQDQLQAATEAATRAEAELQRLTASQDAAVAAADREAAASKLAATLEEALVQHVAATMLAEALAAVEASRGDNQLLGRIGATFAALTRGTYDRLSPAREDADSKAHGRLIAHEAGGADRHLAHLSEGTRDQFYLALRLVAIEEHIRRAPALPFVADDILQTFDDARARAALETLVELSRHVQVIVLTHHPHLLALAEGLPVHVQRL